MGPPVAKPTRTVSDFSPWSAPLDGARLDLSLIVDVIVFERERVIRQQQEAIRELSTPVMQVRERLLILPIIGALDGQRVRTR